ncbi:MAG: flagellar basal body rod protein FlgC [Planctomycetota bacterium]|jgi:flagellar basal-body rod protein FlgC
MVKMPNVKLPNEMVDLITASRSYEANLKALSLFKEMVEQTLTLLRGR